MVHATIQHVEMLFYCMILIGFYIGNGGVGY